MSSLLLQRKLNFGTVENGKKVFINHNTQQGITEFIANKMKIRLCFQINIFGMPQVVYRAHEISRVTFSIIIRKMCREWIVAAKFVI